MCVIANFITTHIIVIDNEVEDQERLMKAVGYRVPGAIDREDALVDIELETPTASGRDLLVAVKAVSVNPVDTKVRRGMAPVGDAWRVLGWDAAGVVAAVGEAVGGFAVGEEV